MQRELHLFWNSGESTGGNLKATNQTSKTTFVSLVGGIDRAPVLWLEWLQPGGWQPDSSNILEPSPASAAVRQAVSHFRMTAVAPEEAAGEAQTNFHLRITGFRGGPGKGAKD